MSGADHEAFRIHLDGVDLTLGERPVFSGLSCGFEPSRITVVLGGSGAGKSTLLRLIGGLTRPDAGVIRIAGQDITRLSERDLFKTRRSIGMLFQGGALLDSMTIFENVALPLHEHTDLAPEAVAAEVARRLEAVGLPGTEGLLPRQLSGGMRRRVALARAIVMDPEIVLCDEPFSGLDPVNVRRIEQLLVELNRRLQLTLIVTSHHIASSLRMAHRLVFLSDGRSISGTPDQLLASGDERVVEFLAAENDGSERASVVAMPAAGTPRPGGAS